MISAQVESRAIEARLGRDSLLVKKLKEVGVAPIQIPDVLKVIDTTCHSCWDADKKCNCWRDE